MINFETFINSIHSAILSANDALVDKNLELLDKFFEETEGSEDFQETLDEALKVTKSVVSKSRRPTKKSLSKAIDALEKVAETLSGKDGLGVDSEQARLPGGLRPRMATVQYPQQTANGVVMSDVLVPLITLVPLSMTHISEVKLRSEMEIQIGDDEELMVSFPTPSPSANPDDPSANTDDSKSSKKSLSGEKTTTGSESIATLEIRLTPHTGTEGLKELVKGYEKMLKSQIPS